MLRPLGHGQEGALALVADNKLNGLYMVRAWLDSGGEPERSPMRMHLADRIVDA